ncbi:MAG: hypothetical protein VKN72_07620 [Nostocales cyanobacterium 94392]|nr:hypothetical protein [Nostocales cyanobacterium 94392]
MKLNGKNVTVTVEVVYMTGKTKWDVAPVDSPIIGKTYKTYDAVAKALKVGEYAYVAVDVETKVKLPGFGRMGYNKVEKTGKATFTVNRHLMREY